MDATVLIFFHVEMGVQQLQQTDTQISAKLNACVTHLMHITQVNALHCRPGLFGCMDPLHAQEAHIDHDLTRLTGVTYRIK